MIVEDEHGDNQLVLQHLDGSIVGPEFAREVITHLAHGYNQLTEDMIERSYDWPRVEHRRVIDPSEVKNWRGYIYLMEQRMDGSRPIYKIGRTEGKHPVNRLRSLQLASGTPITLIDCALVHNIKTEEKFLHKRFSKKRGLGEWFTLDNDDVLWICEYFRSRELPSQISEAA